MTFAPRTFARTEIPANRRNATMRDASLLLPAEGVAESVLAT